MQSIRTAVRNGRQLPRQGAIVWYAVLGLSLASLVTMATWSYAQDEAEPAEEGVRGILPYEVPEDLTEDSFASLDGNWTDWSAGVAQTLVKFYESESLDLAAQREIIADLKGKLKVMEASLADARYRQLHDPIGDLHGKLARRVKLAEAVLDTLALDPDAARTAQLEANRKKVGRTLAALDAYLRKMNNGTGWLDFLETPEVQKFVDAKDLPKDVPAALKTTHRKLKAAGKLPEKSQRDFLTRPPFKALETAIGGYVEAASTEPADTAELSESLATLVEALERHELEQTSEAAAEARQAFGAVKSTAPDGGDLISEVLRSYYFNFNMKIVISEALLNRIVGEDRTHEGPVRDHILGANVYGNQTTNSRVGIDLRPNNSAARFDLTLNGTVQSSTQGVTDRATVYTSGHHQYWARKPITFDGLAFKLSEATIQVSANNTTTGASTGADGTLFGGIAENVAIRTARGKRSQSEAIARQRVSSRVLPEFNKEVDNKFTTANEDF